MGIDEYHEIHYKENTVELIRKVDSEGYAYTPQKVLLILDENERIVERIEMRDTTFYFYSENGLLEESIFRNGGYCTITRRFFFDSNHNLIQITGKIDNHDETSADYDIYEYFELYDNGINGFKDLGIIEGAFIRSLSQNNFNLYRCEMYDDEGILQSAMRLTLDVWYNENGHPIYGDCSLKDVY